MEFVKIEEGVVLVGGQATQACLRKFVVK